MAKMTAKEFWQILADAEYSSIKDYERILNALVGYEFRNEETMRQLGKVNFKAVLSA